MMPYRIRGELKSVNVISGNLISRMLKRVDKRANGDGVVLTNTSIVA